jgi:threonine dehydratase
VIAGQGTIGLEMLEARPDLATILVPLSGGGLAAGVAVAAKAINPAVRVIGVTMDRGAAMHASLAPAPGRGEEVPSSPTASAAGSGWRTACPSRSAATSRRRGAGDRGGDLPRHAGSLLRGPDRGRRRLRRRHRRAAVGQGDAVGPVATIITGRNLDMEMFTRIVTGQDVTLGDYIVKGGPMPHDIRS